MAIFNKSSSGTTLNSSSETTVILSDARIEGEFRFASMLHVGGGLNDIMHSEGIVVIRKDGNLKGGLKADKIAVNDCFEGDLKADSLEILAGGVVSGNINIKDSAIENGGRSNGASKIEQEEPIRLLENSPE